MLIKQTRVGSRVYRWSIMATTAEWRGALSFSPQLRYFPRVVVCEPVRHTRPRGRRVFNGTARGTLYNIRATRSARSNCQGNEGGMENDSYTWIADRFAKRVTCLQTFREFPFDSRSSTRWNVRSAQTDSKVPFNFIPLADVKVGLSSVIRVVRTRWFTLIASFILTVSINLHVTLYAYLSTVPILSIETSRSRVYQTRV